MDLSVEAKREYLSMLCQVMSPILCETFTEMYKEAQTRSNRHRDQIVKIFIVLLEEVENWNNSIIATHTTEYETRCHYFSDLLAAVFVCYVKILSSVRITREPKKLPIKLPSNADFIHACLIQASKTFKIHYQIFREENQMKKELEIQRICAESVEKTLNKLIPIQQILRTYISDTSAFDLNDQVIEAPEGPEAPEDPFAPPENLSESDEPEPEESPPAAPVVPQEEKIIPVAPVGPGGPVGGQSPNLFDDAVDKFSRTSVNERAS